MQPFFVSEEYQIPLVCLNAYAHFVNAYKNIGNALAMWGKMVYDRAYKPFVFSALQNVRAYKNGPDRKVRAA